MSNFSCKKLDAFWRAVRVPLCSISAAGNLFGCGFAALQKQLGLEVAQSMWTRIITVEIVCIVISLATLVALHFTSSQSSFICSISAAGNLFESVVLLHCNLAAANINLANHISWKPVLLLLWEKLLSYLLFRFC